MSGDIKMTMWIFYASRRPDLDESLILDLLQGVVYLNDRQVKERHVFWGLDPDKPRVEMIIEQIPDVYTKKKPAHRRAKKGE
jgi:Holliday junction resolvase RusA-like endonuclease